MVIGRLAATLCGIIIAFQLVAATSGDVGVYTLFIATQGYALGMTKLATEDRLQTINTVELLRCIVSALKCHKLARLFYRLETLLDHCFMQFYAFCSTKGVLGLW